MKRKLLLIIIIFNIFSLISFSQENTAEIISSKEKPSTGDEIILNFNITSTHEIYGFEIDMTYDETLFQTLDNKVIIGELLNKKNHFIAFNELGYGKIHFMGTLLGEGQSIKEGTLFKVKVKTLKEGNPTFNVSKLRFLDVDEDKVNMNFNFKEFNIYKNNFNDKSSTDKGLDSKSVNINIQGPREIVDKIKIEELNIPRVEGLIPHGNIYEITTSETSLSTPITITLPIDRDMDMGSLGIYYYNEDRDKWLYIGGVRDLENSTISVTVNHLTKFAVFACEKKDFVDMEDHWSKSYVNRLYRMDFINGYADGYFRPDDFITRGEMAVILARALDVDISSQGYSTIRDEASFPSWAKTSICAVVESGLFKGYVDGSFMPNKNISRAELLNVISKVLPEKEVNKTFMDMDEVPTWAEEGIKLCASHGILMGDEEGYIRPRSNITRGEAVTMIYRLLEILKI